MIRFAALTGIDPVPVWQWGLLERTATGLLCMKLEMKGPRDMLTVTDARAEAVE